MGSHMNFKNMAADGSNGRPSMGNYSLARQPSVYSLTFDEFQNSLGGLGKDFGSMNMDEFLKNIWTAEETQVMTSAFGVAEGGPASSNLQRQGSLTLPRTLSQKTVDEVWRDMFRENGGRDGNNGNSGLNLPQREPTLGEITLEEFLVRAGVVREETQLDGRPDNSGFYGELARSSNDAGLGLGFLDTGRSNGMATNRILENNNNQITNQSPNLAINVNGIRSSQQTQQQQQQQQLLLFPKQANMGYASSMQLASNGENGNVGLRSSVMGIGDPTMSNGFTQGGGGMGMIGLGTGGVTVAVESPSQLSSDGLGKSNGDTSSLSPVPYVFNGIKGKKCSGAVEKVVERRQRRMIKNRESAARSRARKQAYTMELEAEVAKLKEENKELQKKQVLETNDQQHGPKRRCLRRTQTGPW
ncbi:bZIP transcription factor TRAB1-like isoform X2 [Magnolia sinica]|uniref:bZIP transcription factor TRAB1-like isoform X2 n=1 Tax=Magnolia sinica TaxID=86752 RepID=UPI00265B2577|nr:bZIP transcription factor TRAB1-like isoform X2 [Magnolia sinica]